MLTINILLNFFSFSFFLFSFTFQKKNENFVGLPPDPPPLKYAFARPIGIIIYYFLCNR